jgi:hypothetical protein
LYGTSLRGLLLFAAWRACRLANNPLETACELGIIAGLSQLRVLEFGLIFDGASQHHDVPRALEAVGDLQQLQVRARRQQQSVLAAAGCDGVVLSYDELANVLISCGCTHDALYRAIDGLY